MKTNTLIMIHSIAAIALYQKHDAGSANSGSRNIGLAVTASLYGGGLATQNLLVCFVPKEKHNLCTGFLLGKQTFLLISY